jgi:hypothetical protein
VSRRVIRYEPTRPDDGALRQRLRELAAERRRFGYRRLARLEQSDVNMSRTFGCKSLIIFERALGGEKV